MSDGPRKLETRLVRAGRDPALTGGGVNPTVQRASTLLQPTAADLYGPGNKYGIHGTSTHTALKQALAELEGADHCLVVSSGLLACTVPLMTLAEPGAHILVCDNVYGPTRRFCDHTLRRWGCTTEYFDPDVGERIADMIRPETRVVFIESPGSLTFEVLDTPAITRAARAAGAVTIMDNTWSAGLYHKPLELGVDISVQATSKYVNGSADLLGGSIAVNDARLAARMTDMIAELGLSVAPDEAWLTLRGLRTLPARLARHEQAGLDVARWLKTRPEVAAILHPALEGDRYHDLWKRDFSGAAGLFGVVLKPSSEAAVHAFLNALELFGLGFSWGGFESLAIHCDPQLKRTARKPDFGGSLLRLSIGMEATSDLIADLERGFAAYAASA
ncbi:MAG: cystathionine beta-lyase [Hyphomonadaceae bacterium]